MDTTAYPATQSMIHHQFVWITLNSKISHTTYQVRKNTRCSTPDTSSTSKNSDTLNNSNMLNGNTNQNITHTSQSDPPENSQNWEDTTQTSIRDKTSWCELTLHYRCKSSTQISFYWTKHKPRNCTSQPHTNQSLTRWWLCQKNYQSPIVPQTQRD